MLWSQYWEKHTVCWFKKSTKQYYWSFKANKIAYKITNSISMLIYDHDSKHLPQLRSEFQFSQPVPPPTTINMIHYWNQLPTRPIISLPCKRSLPTPSQGSLPSVRLFVLFFAVSIMLQPNRNHIPGTTAKTRWRRLLRKLKSTGVNLLANIS